ncbi:MAG TPA: 3-keto-5-aminohexanoate cleavage protein [Thermomicrobiales bacterium]|nr:3-keto-5-aminohexanoate cleavage protein [Thermomicrobiales bacterium]
MTKEHVAVVSGSAVVIEAALNGGRDRAENEAVPYTASELAAEARRCADQGATLFHVHARADNGGWTVDPARYAKVLRALREAVPHGLVSITSIRPEGVHVEEILNLLEKLAGDPGTKPDMISLNLGHIVAWEPVAGGSIRRRTTHFPNAYEDIVRLLAACETHGVRPELGVMDLGFVANAVALRDDGVFPEQPWFLIELDSPAYDSGVQVAPSTVANYRALAAPLRRHFPAARWAAHGQGVAGYAVIKEALANGEHVRVGFEDAVHLPDGRPARSNAELVRWVVATAQETGWTPATVEDARVITGCRA